MMRSAGARQLAASIVCLTILGTAACDQSQQVPTELRLEQVSDLPIGTQQFPLIQLPPGFRIEKVVDGLNYPSSLAWDDHGRLYVVESGSGLTPAQLAPPRILRVENGRATAVVNLDGRVVTAVVGIVWYRGAFYITHRSVADRTDAVSRVTLEGGVTQLFNGIIDGQSEHQINDIRVGPDGRMYITAGLSGNAAVISNELMGFVRMTPGVRATACRNIVLTGQNFETPDFRTPDPHDVVRTGAFVPYGTTTTPGKTIAGTEKCGGSILSFDPANAEATLRMFAWGFRNPIGIAWNRGTGEMYTAMNGYDVRGSRPVRDEWDATYRVVQGTWYGVPDFSAALDPLTEARFEPPDELQAPVFIGTNPVGKILGFVIDHRASHLTAPSKSLIAGLHVFQSSPSMIDAAPASWGAFAGQLFVSEYGDLRPPTNPLETQPVGFRIVRVQPGSGIVEPFVRNAQPGPASIQGGRGQGLERPFDVEFGPDGAMYIVDYGEVQIDLSRVALGMAPYVEIPHTGAIWRVSQETSATQTYEVTVSNLTTGQPFSPGVVATHSSEVNVFQLGARASEGIRRIAEDGEPETAVSELGHARGVFAVVNTMDPIHRIGGPGPTSRTFTIQAGAGANRLSLAVMLICTNDGFTGLNSVPLPSDAHPVSFDLLSYDSGTEANDELFHSIVDPCQAIGPLAAPPDGNARTATSGVITRHNRIQGVGNLVPSLHSWHDPVARVTIRRTR